MSDEPTRAQQKELLDRVYPALLDEVTAEVRAELEQIAADFKAANPHAIWMADQPAGGAYYTPENSVTTRDVERFFSERGHTVHVEIDWKNRGYFTVTPIVSSDLGISIRKVDE